MKRKYRIQALAAGAVVTIYGLAMVWRGTFAYHNSYSMTLYPPAVIATGFLLCCVSLLPMRWLNWIVRRS
ncbi:MAG: hypothetical protein DMG80_11175 [Acidobacteria bacterium]|nr:MAG: hypothetical protein DMG80_11175 [Acidobacteriota bacterium]